MTKNKSKTKKIRSKQNVDINFDCVYKKIGGFPLNFEYLAHIPKITSLTFTFNFYNSKMAKMYFNFFFKQPLLHGSKGVDQRVYLIV